LAGNTRTSGTSVTQRVLAILGTFDETHRAQTLTEIAQRADLTVPTAHRLVGELSGWGALRRDARGRYVVGRRLWDIGLLVPMQTGLREVASPFLHDIYGTTLETVHLAVREGNQALYVDVHSGHRSYQVVSKVGTRLPLHPTGVGKVLLAHAPEDVQRKILSGPLERCTPYTIVDPARLEKQLVRVRQEGYAYTVEEMSLGGCSVAVPIYAEGRVIAALGIVVPDLRRTRGRLVAALQVAAQGINRSLAAQRTATGLSSSGSGPRLR